MNIPDKAIEAAVQALFEDGCGEPKVDAVTALEAAYKFIAAQVLQDEASCWTAGEVRVELLRSAAGVEAGTP